MIVSLQTHRHETLDQLRSFVAGNAAAEFRSTERESAYEFVRRTLVRFRYPSLGKADKGVVRAYLAKATGFSRSQLARLIRQYRQTGTIRDRRRDGPARPFPRRYTKADIGLLADIDATLGQQCGPTTRAVMRRQYEEYGDERFERLAGISNGHFYNLRGSTTYSRRRTVFKKTRASQVQIAERRKPQPLGLPGYLRVDTVHQGDRDGEKGVYHINAVDEVIQWQEVATVRAISERCLLPVLERMIESYPFVISGFHVDNGSEYINWAVDELLKRLQVDQFTKSRARKSNDNALVESKNGSSIRGFLGYGHIPRLFDAEVDAFVHRVLSPHLNYHHPCLFPSEEIDASGRTVKRYRDQDIKTPFEKLKSLPSAERHLKTGVSLEQLEAQARAESDLQSAENLNAARSKLFDLIAKETAQQRRTA